MLPIYCLGRCGSRLLTDHESRYLTIPLTQGTAGCKQPLRIGIELLGLLLAGSTSQQWQVEMGWPDIHVLARA
jgi:hypothetical protein